MYADRGNQNEYGGFLPLELNPGNEFFLRYGKERIMRFNCVKASIAFLIEQIQPKRIHIPFYYCPTTIEAIKQMNIEIVFYHIDNNLMPENISDNLDEMVLLVDYFGIRTREIIEIAQKLQKCQVLIDFAHSFFAEPLYKGNVFNVYSAKKFFGIPDGAYLVSEKIFLGKKTSKINYSNEYAEYLLKSYEEGTNAAYQMKKSADQVIAGNYGGMSKLSMGLLENVNYDRVKRTREVNYQVLYEKLQSLNELKIPKSCIAYQYPLLISRCGHEIKQKLIQNKIYAPTLWRGNDLLNNGNEFERNMSKNAIFIPVDQRYDEEDMHYIASMTKMILKDISSII